MESLDSLSENKPGSNKQKKEVPLDWRPQAIRIFSIFFVVVGHMLFFTQYLENDAVKEPLVWFGGLAIAFFMVCSGYVHGLKDEFNKPGALTGSSYVKFFKSRFFRLYLGYYLAIIIVIVAKLMAGFSMTFSATAGLQFGVTRDMILTPTSLILDLTCMWPLVTMNLGGLWPEGWFISAMIILSLSYPLLRKIHSMNKYYLYLIMIFTTVVRILVIIFINANYAYYFPFAWTAEFSLGIILGDRVRRGGGPKPPSASYQKVIISLGTRVWPLYLVHMAAVVFMFDYAPVKDFLFTILVFLILTEIFYRILSLINNKLGFIKKKTHPPRNRTHKPI